MVKELFRPATKKEAVSLLARHKGKAKVLAGGTDLIVLMRAGKVQPEVLVSLNRVKGLRNLSYSSRNGLRIGALVTHSELMENEAVQRHYPVLMETAKTLAGPPVRNAASVAGNLCHAAPSADFAPPLLTLDASVVLFGPKGERTVPLPEFFKAPNKTVLAEDEILSEIRVPSPAEGSGASYLKLGVRSAMEIAMVSVAASLTRANGKCTGVRVALGAVAPTPMLAESAAGAAEGKAPSAEVFAKAGEAAAKESKPITDIRASAEYRKKMVAVLTRRALARAAGL
ncbi:MAG: FAD binding domain-containing protein [Nitrospinota bacterium]